MTQILDPELFLPEPEPVAVKYIVISVDDHLVEPPDMCEGRLPAKLRSTRRRSWSTRPATRSGSSRARPTTRWA